MVIQNLQTFPWVSSKTFHKILLLTHRYLDICIFACFSKNCIKNKYLSVKSFSPSFTWFSKSFGISTSLNNFSNSMTVFCSSVLKRVLKFVWCVLKYVFGLRFLHHQQQVLFVFWDAPCFSKFKKNLSIFHHVHTHLLLNCIPSLVWSYITSISFILLLYLLKLSSSKFP